MAVGNMPATSSSGYVIPATKYRGQGTCTPLADASADKEDSSWVIKGLTTGLNHSPTASVKEPLLTKRFIILAVPGNLHPSQIAQLGHDLTFVQGMCNAALSHPFHHPMIGQ